MASQNEKLAALTHRISILEAEAATERQRADTAIAANEARYKAGFIDGLCIARLEAEKAAAAYRQHYLDTDDRAGKIESLGQQVALDQFSLWLSGESARVKAADGMPPFFMRFRAKVPEASAPEPDVARAA